MKNINSAYKALVLTRGDDPGFIKYFTKEDFQGLQATQYKFITTQGNTLTGYFYSYPGFDKKRLVIFEHGLGGGHNSYMKEIEKLCSMGYLVFAYDHTGCMESEGESPMGFSQSLRDLDDCIKTLKADERVNTSDISVVGHSWGGYATLNICAFHSDVKKIVVLSGIISVRRMIEQHYKPDVEYLMELETARNPQYVGYEAAETLKDADIEALLIYSSDDHIIGREPQYDILYQALKDKNNIKLVLMEGKGHNPNYDYDAVAYLAELNSRLAQGLPQTAEEKEKFKNSFDWDRMTKQDETVWERIKNFLK